MSQPPPGKAGFTRVPPLPPFPQLMHIKDSPPRQRSFSGEPAPTDDDGGHVTAEEEDADEAVGSKEVKKEKKPHATRRRVVQSCSECRRRKIKCDKKFPCGPCILRQDQARCHEVGTAEKQLVASSNYATTQDLANLAHRVDALEAALIKAGSLVPADLEKCLTQIRSKVVVAPAPESAHAPAANPPMGNQMHDDDGENVSDTEGAALTLEHLAFGRSRVDGSHSLPHFRDRRISSVMKPVPGQGYHLASSGHAAGESPSQLHQNGAAIYSPGHKRPSIDIKSSTTAEERTAHMLALADTMHPGDVFDMYFKKTDIILNALTRVLPDQKRGEILVNAFLLKVDWLHRLFHVPTFLSQCRDLWALPRERVIYEISMPFMAVYFVVITLGLHFMDDAEAKQHFTDEEVQTLSDTWYSAARSCQWSSDFIGTHTLENLQGIILMSVLMNNRDRADAAWALLGAAIKMAQGLGLSRLGAEQQSVDGRPLPMWKGRWESVIQREIGRRIWWNLVFLDWSLAPSYNYACSIQPDQIKSALPANIEDEDLIDGQPLRAQPMNVRTRMSFQLAKLKFAEISQRQIWQANNNNHPPYSFILSVDRELRKAMLELPAYFQPESNPAPVSSDPKKLVEHYEKITLSLAIHSRMLRLHRPWLSRGYEDERYAYSKEQCIRAARASLRMMSDNIGVARFLEKWWIPLFYVTVSGMVVIIDLLKTAKREMKSKATEEKIAEVKSALDQMRHISQASIPAKAAIKVMDFLMSEVEERRRPGGTALGKRKTLDGELDDEEHNLQRAVKRLIRQAQLETDSPTPSGGASFVSPSSDPSGPLTQSPRELRADPTPERPVFGAYPMPSAGLPPNQPPTEAPSQPSIGASFPGQFALQGGGAGFNFSVDQNVSTFPALDQNSFQPQGPPHLDPAVESMLASYFPPATTTTNPGELGPAAASQVPDDFLSRVFSFSWDNTQGGTATPNQSTTPNQTQVATPGVRPNGLQGQPRPGPNGQQPGYGAFDWSSHGWMA